MGADRLIFFGASITNADVVMTDGKSLEKTGVTPDELIRPTPNDLTEGRDPVLARAAAVLELNLDPVTAGAIVPGRMALTRVLPAVLIAAALAAPAPVPSWTVLKSGVTARLRGVSASSANVVWASGTDGTVIRTEDAGQKWVRLNVPGDREARLPGHRRNRRSDGLRAEHRRLVKRRASTRRPTRADSWTLQFTQRGAEGLLRCHGVPRRAPRLRLQ